MEVSLSLAQWVVGKALAPVTDHLLESWAASAGLNPNIEALKMELLYAQGMLENAQGMDICSSALNELLQILRQLAYRADDVLDELVYFRIQDLLDGTYHATVDVHELGCADGLVLNVRHIAKDVASTLKFPSCSCAASRGDPDHQRGNGGKQGCLSGVRSCRSHEIGSNQVASSASTAAHTVGKHFRFYTFPSMALNKNRIVQTPKLEFNRVDMSKKMVDIVGQLKPVCAMVSTILNLELLSSSRTLRKNISINRPRTTRVLIEPPFCGRDGLKKMIVDNVTHEYSANKLTVLPIVGTGGIGKTTLTHHVFKELESHFQVSIWICVSVNFSANRIIRKIVKMIPEIRGENKYGSDEELIEQRLKDHKFLLVLDDVWKCHKDEWSKLLAPFNKGRAMGNMILVTTRFQKVAKMVRTTDCSVAVERLDTIVMMSLFGACVFGCENPWFDYPELFDIGMRIVSNLNGSPLAAKTIAGSLREHLTLRHWVQVLESKEWQLQNSTADTMSALRLSYDNLPFSLRQCLAYCGLFPEDYEFDQKELVQLWIALDILPSGESDKRVEDVGLCYINELVNYGFLQVKTREYDCHPYYLIHDLVHELATMVLPYECLRIHSSNASCIQIPPSVRHLSIIVDDIDVWDRINFEQYKTDLSALGKRLKVEDLRTLMLFGEYHGSFANIFGDLFGEARALRTLILSGASYNVEDMFGNFSRFVHLRYLRIKSMHKNDIFLSSAVCRFYHLEILDLEEWHGEFGTARYMSNLVKLHHFHVPEYKLQVHSDIFEVGKLKFLQELRRFVVGKESTGFEPSQLGKLSNIRGSLGIHNLERVQTEEEAEEIELMEKNYLEKLTLEWDIGRLNRNPLQEGSVLEGLVPHSNIQDLCIRGHGGATCPSWLGNFFVTYLKCLCLYDIAWENFQLTSRQRFKILTRLELVKIPGLRKIAGNELCGFWLHLEVFIIQECPELLELPISPNQNYINWFPRLRELRVVDCPKLLSLPPIPWTLGPCSANIEKTGLGFEHLVCSEKYKSELSLEIKGKDGQGNMLWNGLSFSNLMNLAVLEMKKCPPLPLVHLQMLTSLKVLVICDSSHLLSLEVEGGRRVECVLPLEDVSIRQCDATAEELTWLLSHSPRITKLSVEYCEKITGLGVAEQEYQMTATPVTSLADKMQQEARDEEIGPEDLLLLPPQLQELQLLCCRELQLLSTSLEGLLSLHTLKIRDCPKFLFSYPSSSSCFLFPASLEKLTLASMKGLETLEFLSNLTSLTTLSIHGCEELVGRGLWSPSSDRFFFKLQDLQTDGIAGFLVAPICSCLSSSLTNLSFSKIQETHSFTSEEEEALHLLTSLEELQFNSCNKLQCLPAGLIGLTNLKRLQIECCPAIRTLPENGLPSYLHKLAINACTTFESLPKDGLPSSLRELVINDCPAFESMPKKGLPSSLQKLVIIACPAFKSLPKKGLPCSLQKLIIIACPAFKSLPKKGLPNSLCELDVSGTNSEKLRRQCYKLNGTIPIIRA